MKYLNLFLIGLTLALTSCKSTNKNFDSNSVVFEKGIETDIVKADLIINDKNKITGESTATYFMFFNISGDNTYADGIQYNSSSKLPFSNIGTTNKVKSAAAYKALNQDGGYDVILQPQYTVTVEKYPFVKVYKATVTGYGARYKNFRSVK